MTSSDQHLLAEYHELPHCIKQPSDAPAHYTLGKGHMKWAKKHTIFLLDRYTLLWRGFKPTFPQSSLIDHTVIDPWILVVRELNQIFIEEEMKKRYLRTVEDVIALRDTDTKIYAEDECGYYKFVNGYFCCFQEERTYFNITVFLSEEGGSPIFYILEEESMPEATEEDIGKLCWFWNEDGVYYIGTLKSIDEKSTKRFYMLDIGYYEYCHRLTPSEVAELTGYKVEEAE